MAKKESLDKVLEFFCRICTEGFSPNETTFTVVLGACTVIGLKKCGEFVHAKAVKLNWSSDAIVGSSLVELYGKCHEFDMAVAAFRDISNKNVVTWNALISGSTNERAVSPCLVFFKEMMVSGLRPNESTFSSVLKSASTSDLKQLHSLIIRAGYDSNDYVSSSIIASYAAHGLISDALICANLVTENLVSSSNAIAGIYNRSGEFKLAEELVSRQEDPDNMSWNILLTANVRNGKYLEAFQLFKRMQESAFLLDNYTAVSLLSICTRINGLDLGCTLHGLILKTNAGCSDVFVQNVLMDMYAKCGSLACSLSLFDEMPERNLVSWTVLISGLGLHGRCVEAVQVFQQMQQEGFVPDGVAFSAILSACRHGGLVEEGMRIFNRMGCVYGVEPEMNHCLCIVDLLCGFGRLKEARVVIDEMKFQPNAMIWRLFLQGCKKYSLV
ncbi:hypothetical protein HPP92_024493 [Vanilla planifolia]|nr:hypothetical protein HPP92_024493 [Vanilla planifolia]